MHFAAAAKTRPASGRHYVTWTSDGHVVVRIEGNFDFELARAVVREATANMAENPRALVIELMRVTDIYSFSLGALKLLCDKMHGHQSTIRLVDCSPRVVGLFEPGILDQTFQDTRILLQK